ncbi:hypothetical protein GOBAR_AA07888 [Gossypium barbadense]|uniref:Uncharacterized protein n=1 Tax=Gossypium barbadense TaxID=3634 RepID=A0A2P5YB10_GOSBA|nr:hypothetical protein GOBAR_AA07888 [Gossypium barbadense]
MLPLMGMGATGAKIGENAKTNLKANSRTEGGEDVGTEGGDDVDSEGNESEYMDSSELEKYGDKELSNEEIDTSYLGKKIISPRYDPNYVIQLWEIGLRFEDNQQFKEVL